VNEKEKTRKPKQNNAKREYSLGLYPSHPIPSSTAGGVAENVAALAREDRYNRSFPMWQWGRGVSAQGGWVGNKEHEKSRTWEIKNASCGKDGDLEVWEQKRTIVVRVCGPCVQEPWPRTGPATCHTFFRRPPRHCISLSGRVLRALPNWQWVVPTRHLIDQFQLKNLSIILYNIDY